jgi:hypothetical protein
MGSYLHFDSDSDPLRLLGETWHNEGEICATLCRCIRGKQPVALKGLDFGGGTEMSPGLKPAVPHEPGIQMKHDEGAEN